MRRLILSDLHANLEALEAVVEAAKGEYDEIVCLGDIVGYGADPNAVVDWTRTHCAHVIRGNHDKTCCGLEDASLFNPMARAAVDWTFQQLSDPNRQWLRDLRQGPLDIGDLVMVHGSVLDEDEYLLDINDAAAQFQHMVGRIVFFGHTHVQGGFFLRSTNGTPPAVAPNPTPTTVTVRPGDSLLINPGSVGQPRDLDWRAGYALYDVDSQRVEYHRCEYDVEKAQDKIRRAGLPVSLADRLGMGR